VRDKIRKKTDVNSYLGRKQNGKIKPKIRKEMENVCNLKGDNDDRKTPGL
jgi:hypothetical protein